MVNQNKKTENFTILLGRHGRADHSYGQIYAGSHYDSDLTRAGHGDASVVAGKIIGAGGCDLIVSSKLERSIETSNDIKDRMFARKGIEVPVLELSEFNEINLGDFDGKTRQEVLEKFPEQAKCLHERDIKKWRFPHGESYNDVVTRANLGLEKIKQICPNGRVLIIAHAMFNRAFLSELLPENPEFWHEIIFYHDLVLELTLNDDHKWFMVKQY